MRRPPARSFRLPTLRRLTLRQCIAASLTPLLAAAAAHAITPQNKPVILRNGQTVDLRGTLAVQHRGWKQFLVLRTTDPYALAPDAVVATYPIPHPVTREFGLTLAGQDDHLAHLAGKAVRVSARLQFTPESPYLWNGTLLWATVVALPSGEYLDPRLPEPGLPLSVRRYTATATLRPAAWTRTYTARDLETRKPLTRPNLAGCSVSGGGDVLNCACTDGFRPTSAVLHTAFGDRNAAMVSSFAQFSVGDPASTPITAELECARTAPASASRQLPR